MWTLVTQTPKFYINASGVSFKTTEMCSAFALHVKQLIL